MWNRFTLYTSCFQDIDGHGTFVVQVPDSLVLCNLVHFLDRGVLYSVLLSLVILIRTCTWLVELFMHVSKLVRSENTDHFCLENGQFPQIPLMSFGPCSTKCNANVDTYDTYKPKRISDNVIKITLSKYMLVLYFKLGTTAHPELYFSEC